MPLDLSSAKAPPTLGRRKTKEEIRQELSRKYDVKSGLRQQGGFVSFDSPWDKKKRKEYKRLLMQEEAQITAQFGQLPEDWSYLTDREAVALLHDFDSQGSVRRSTDLEPVIRLWSDTRSSDIHVELSYGPNILRNKVSYATIYDPSVEITGERLRYDINKLIALFAEGKTSEHG